MALILKLAAAGFFCLIAAFACYSVLTSATDLSTFTVLFAAVAGTAGMGLEIAAHFDPDDFVGPGEY